MTKSKVKTSLDVGIRRILRRGLQPNERRKIKTIWNLLRGGCTIGKLPPNFKQHQLKGPMSGCRAVSITGNWRLVFHLDGDIVSKVEYVDYH